jgi:hypothetical protein
MSEESMEITTTSDWRPKALIIGGAIGAIVGVGAAYLLVQRAGDEEVPNIGVADVVKMGLLIFGLLRSISNL